MLRLKLICVRERGPSCNIECLIQIDINDKRLEHFLVNCHKTSMVFSQHWFRWWFGAIRHQAIPWANVDLCRHHYGDIIMGAIASQITSLTIVYSTVYSDADQRKHQSSASLAFVRGIHRGPVNSPHKWPVTRKMFPFDDVIMIWHH